MQFWKTYYIKEASLRKVKKAILDLKSEVLGLQGNAKKAFASSDEEENDELDMHVFWDVNTDVALMISEKSEGD